MDSHYCSDAGKFIAMCLTSLTTILFEEFDQAGFSMAKDVAASLKAWSCSTWSCSQIISQETRLYFLLWASIIQIKVLLDQVDSCHSEMQPCSHWPGPG